MEKSSTGQGKVGLWRCMRACTWGGGDLVPGAPSWLLVEQPEEALPCLQGREGAFSVPAVNQWESLWQLDAPPPPQLRALGERCCAGVCVAREGFVS